MSADLNEARRQLTEARAELRRIEAREGPGPEAYRVEAERHMARLRASLALGRVRTLDVTRCPHNLYEA